MSDRVQVFHPVHKRWALLDPRNGMLVAIKKTPGQWANVPVRPESKPEDGEAKSLLRGFE